MPDHADNPSRLPPDLVRGVRKWVLLRHRWFRHLPRWQRWVIRVGVGVPLVLVASYFVLTRSPLTGAIILPRLASALNLAIDADAVRITLDGRLVLEGVTCRIPGVEGAAGRVAEVERVSADIDWWRTLRGTARVRQVELLQPVVRVSLSLADESLNIEKFRLLEGRRRPGPVVGAPPLLELPRVIADDGAIELGEHDGSAYTLLKRLPVEGMLTPAPHGERGYVVGLMEHRRGRGGRTGLGFKIHGRFDSTSISLVMDDFDLADWPAPTVPTPLRRLFEELNLQGKVTRATFDFEDRKGVTAGLVLDGVELNLPFAPAGHDPKKFMRMHGVTGSATFKHDSVVVRAQGRLEDLPYSVTLLYEGTTPDSPFTCEIVSEGFQVERYPKLLPYAPPLVHKRLATFSGPTATVTTRLQISRGRATASGPADIRFKGSMDVTNGRAAFDKFPYPFEKMAGRVLFDNDKVEIRGVTGVSPSGAKLSAHGVITPISEDAEIDIFVTVDGAPVDEAMEEAFGPGRDRLMHALFNKTRHRALLDAGLIATPEQAGAWRRELDAARAARDEPGADREGIDARIADLEAKLARPVFELGGVADVSVHVHRPPGDKVEWDSNVDVRLRTAGLVPEAFPLPVRLIGVTCQIHNDQATISGGEYHGLTGGEATVLAHFSLPPSSNPDADPRPDVSIDARGIPFDALMIHALPGPDDGALKRVLRGLRLSGTGEGHVRIAPQDLLGRAPRAERTPIGFDADVKVSGVRAAPAGSAEPDAADALVADGAGTLRVTERTLELAMQAVTSGEVGGGAPLDISTTASFAFRGTPDAPPTPPRIEARVRGSGLDLRAPVERIIRAFSARAADEVVKLRAKHHPAGVVDAETRVLVADNATQSVMLEVTAARDISFDWLGGRVAAAETRGRVEVECARGVTARFDGLSAAMMFDAGPVADVTLDGRYRFTPPAGGVLPFEGADRVLRVRATNGRFESPFVTAVLAAPVGRERLAAYERLEPRGTFDAEVNVRDGWQQPRDAATPGPLRVSGTLEPRAFACTIDGVEVAFERCGGWASFGGAEGVFNQLSGHAPGWSFTVNGGWRQSEGGVILDLGLTSAGESLTPDARVILPAKLRAAMDSIKLRLAGPFSLSDARLTLLAGVAPERAWTRFRGELEFQGASLEPGASLSGCEGRLLASYDQQAGAPPSYRVAIFADRIDIAGVQARDARAVLTSGDEPGEVLVPMLSGECRGGRFAGRVRVSPVGTGDKEYAATFQVAGVDFGLMLHDLSRRARETAIAAGTTPPPLKPEPEPGARGELSAELSLGGFVAIPETRRGRGTMRVAGDKVRIIDLPGVLPLIEVSNLQLPAGDALDHAEAAFFIDGGVISFDRLSVYSGTVEIVGYGTMTWPGQDLDLRVNSRSARPIPMLSWLFTGIRDQLVTTGVRGKLTKPQVRLISMPGTRRMLGAAVGAEESEKSRQLRALERRAGSTRSPIPPTSNVAPRPTSSAGAIPDGP